jgi:hypothetical protein
MYPKAIPTIIKEKISTKISQNISFFLARKKLLEEEGAIVLLLTFSIFASISFIRRSRFFIAQTKYKNPNNPHRKSPVMLFAHCFISQGLPHTTTSPPLSPPSGPISIM